MVALSWYRAAMTDRLQWVLLIYRLPRTPSTPRIGIWRQLRRLGVAQVSDGVVALPLDARTRERLEWLAEEIVEHGGAATIWLGRLATATEERALARQMADAVSADYRRVVDEAAAAAAQPDSVRRRTRARLRRELARIRARDFFPQPISARARLAVEALPERIEAAS
jgi:hypothetical protein